MESIVGGVFALESESLAPPSESVWAQWTKGADAVYCFHNARSAIHHVVREIAPKRVWLPAYLCSDIVDALLQDSTIRFYPVGSDLLDASRAWLDSVEAYDLVLTINYFGRPTPSDITNRLLGMDDVFWVEDRAQCLMTNEDTVSDACIYSPRKLFGVPDGGVLTVIDDRITPPRLEALDNSVYELPYRIRSEDKDGSKREEWYSAFQQAEAKMAVGNHAMSERSRHSLERLNVRELTNSRIQNYQYLQDQLSDLALWPDADFDWVPSGFPLVAPNAEELWKHLCAGLIFPPRHWKNLNSPAGEFPEEHRLSETMMTIPCDQRYAIDDMERVVGRIREVYP